MMAGQFGGKQPGFFKGFSLSLDVLGATSAADGPLTVFHAVAHGPAIFMKPVKHYIW